MEQFLEQSAQAEENFYRMEEQRLQAEDRRREAEHARELHMLQMLGQMFSGLSAAPPARAPGFRSGSPSAHVGRPSPQKDCFTQQSQPLNPESQALGISFGVMCTAWRRRVKEKSFLLFPLVRCFIFILGLLLSLFGCFCWQTLVILCQWQVKTHAFNSYLLLIYFLSF